jgi:hypothetical protein
MRTPLVITLILLNMRVFTLLAVLGSEPRTLYMLSRWATSKAIFQPLEYSQNPMNIKILRKEKKKKVLK